MERQRIRGLVALAAVTVTATLSVAAAPDGRGGPGQPGRPSPTIPARTPSFAWGNPLDTTEGALDAARRLVARNRRLAGDRLPPDPSPSTPGQQARNLDLARSILGDAAAPREDPFDASLRTASQALRWQAATSAYEWAQTPPTRGHDDPREALEALAHRHGVDLTDEQRAKLGRLGHLPHPIPSRLTRLVDAFLALDAAVDRAYEDADVALLRELASAGEGPSPATRSPSQRRRAGPPRAPVGPLRAPRSRVSPARAWTCPQSSPPGNASWMRPGPSTTPSRPSSPGPGSPPPA